MENSLFYIAYVATLAVLLLSSVWDIRFCRIPNLFTIPAILAGIVLSGLRHPVTLSVILPCCIILFFLGFLPVLGKGDLKLIMAVTALCGPCTALATTGIAAAAVVLLRLLRHPGKSVRSIQNTLAAVIHGQFSVIGSDGDSVPFAPYLLFGFLVFLMIKAIMTGGIS